MKLKQKLPLQCRTWLHGSQPKYFPSRTVFPTFCFTTHAGQDFHDQYIVYVDIAHQYAPAEGVLHVSQRARAGLFLRSCASLYTHLEASGTTS